MVKLTKKDKVYLQSIGYLKTDFTQIEEANYKYYAEDNQKIGEEEAIKKLGRVLVIWYRWSLFSYFICKNLQVWFRNYIYY